MKGTWTPILRQLKNTRIITYLFSDDKDIIQKYDDYRNDRNLKPGWVVADHYCLVNDNDFIGEISIRHSLTDSLLKYGGHVGYGIRCSMWNRGYGSLILKLGLEKCKGLCIDNVLITCGDNNYGSARIIEKNGEVLENKIQNVIDGKEVNTRRYWMNNK